LLAAALLSAQQPAPPQPQPDQPQPEQPRVQPAQPPQPEEPVVLVEATKEETWTLGDQVWDFKDVATAYQPVKGTFNPKTLAAEWTLVIAKELAPGEVGLHENIEESPFRALMLDEERIVLDEEPEVRFVSKLTGRPGDKLRIVVQLPSAEVLSLAKHIRIERRTKVGF
jgi:hypothetical protein